MQKKWPPMVEITLKSKHHVSKTIGEKNVKRDGEEEHGITLLYSQRKPERGIAISCNGHCITLLIKALILGDCNQSNDVKTCSK